jgi:hypothetical protein
MELMTYKEFSDKQKGEVKTSPVIMIEKEEDIIDTKEFWLRHPDYPLIKEGDYIIDEKTLVIKEGCIRTSDESMKDKLIQNGFYYLGSKEIKWEIY